MIVYETDLTKEAIYDMEDCYDAIIDGDWERAHRCFGRAAVYEDMLLDVGINLEENDEYRRMKDFYMERKGDSQ